MKIDWVINPFDSNYRNNLFCVVPKGENGNVVKSLVFADTNGPCMMCAMTFERAVEYAWECKHKMPEVSA